MKVIGGSFGTSGSAHISRDNKLVVKAGKKHVFRPDQVTGIDTMVESSGGFDFGRALVGMIFIGGFGLVFLHLVGAVFGILLGFGMGFIKSKRNLAELNIDDGKRITLECSPKAIQWLLEFKS